MVQFSIRTMAQDLEAAAKAGGATNAPQVSLGAQPAAKPVEEKISFAPPIRPTTLKIAPLPPGPMTSLILSGLI